MTWKNKYSKFLSHFRKHDPLLYKYIKDLNYEDWFNNPEEKDYFRALCHSIIGQQLSGKAADAIYSKFLKLFENIPSPENIIKIEEQALRDAGLSWAKVRSIKDLAQKVYDQTVILVGLEAFEDEKIIEELIKVKGIGRWTAEMFLIFTLNRENIFSFGDLGLKKGFQKIYQISEPNPEQIKEVIEKWHPYKTYGSIALWESLNNK